MVREAKDAFSGSSSSLGVVSSGIGFYSNVYIHSCGGGVIIFELPDGEQKR